MSQNSTSVILGKLSDEESNSTQPKENLHQETQEIGEVFAAPQLTPSKAHEMKDVLLNILGLKFSKKNSPMDNH